MALLNVSRIDDSHYRYKMPGVFTKIEGSGNGTKTVIPNLDDVARSLDRDSVEMCKFFGIELGAQARYGVRDGRAVINGIHDTGAIQELVYKYIDMFVLCPECGNPETSYAIKNSIRKKCNACGRSKRIDMTHKLCSHIKKKNDCELKKKRKEKKSDCCT